MGNCCTFRWRRPPVGHGGSSNMACYYTVRGTRYGPNVPNQDAMIVHEDFASRSGCVFCGVFDGHGSEGHIVSSRVKDSLPVTLVDKWKEKPDTSTPADSRGTEPVATEYGSGEPIGIVDDKGNLDREKLPKAQFLLAESFLEAFESMDQELNLDREIESFESGSTAVTLGQHLVLANIGDSRAVLGRRDNENKISALQLTVDLKPDLPGEAARINQYGGRAYPLENEKSSRIWLPQSHSPGLAMSRSFGDFCFKEHGLISIPDMHYLQLTHKDEFIILASDGVWDVLSNEEVVRLVDSVPAHETTARVVVESAVKAWRKKHPGAPFDDCTAVCLFLKGLTSSKYSESSHPTGNT